MHIQEVKWCDSCRRACDPISNFIARSPLKLTLCQQEECPWNLLRSKVAKDILCGVNKEGHNLTNTSSKGFTTFARGQAVHLLRCMRHSSTPSHETHARSHRCSRASSEECQLESTLLHLCLATMPNMQLPRNSSSYP